MLDTTDLAILAALQADAAISNVQLAEHVGASPATTLRRVNRLKADGIIHHTTAILDADALKALIGAGLQVIVEVTLDVQTHEMLTAFETLACHHPSVQQCYRTSPGPDFVLIITAKDMPSYLDITQELFTAQANVRNVKAFFSVKRAKFRTDLPL